ncbi:unnamed protein product [Phaedon cochleariae]|uniref:Uncharacterized protein n=1 Tax=Phaedon cochleariae TaxID=80249 RepID=A0A9P0DVU8_PHACE|nr:unnamed protein product [Phaedon cochleariae]
MADSNRVDQNATRTIIIPKGVLSPDQVNVINIPRNQTSTAPLLVIPRQDGRGVSAKSLPIWNDELSDGDRKAGIKHLVGSPKECLSKSRQQDKTHSLVPHQTDHDFSLSSLYDSSAEMDEKEANMFKNIMDGKYNVIKRMSPSPERRIPKLLEYRGGQGFRPTYSSTPAQNTEQVFMNDTSIPSTMDSQDWYTPDLAGVKSSFDSTLPSGCQTYPPGRKPKSRKSPQDGGSHDGRFPIKEYGEAERQVPNQTFDKVNATHERLTDERQINGTFHKSSAKFDQNNVMFSRGNATFDRPNATSCQPNKTFAKTNSSFIRPNPTDVQPNNATVDRPNRTFDRKYPDSSVACANYSDAPIGVPDQNFSLSSLYDSSAEMDEKEANMFKNIMDGKYNVIKRMSPSPERRIPKLPEYRCGQGFRPRYFSTPAQNNEQQYLTDTSFPSTMDSQDFFTPDLAGVESSFDSTLPSRCQTYPPMRKSRPRKSPQDGGSHAGRFPIRESGGEGRRSNAITCSDRLLDSTCETSNQSSAKSTRGNGLVSGANATFNKPSVSYHPPPSQAQSFPGERGRHNISPQLGRSANAPLSAQAPESSIVQQNYWDAPFGIPIGTRFDDKYLPYESPPSHTKTFPGACGRQRGIPQLAASIERRGTQLGRSVNAPLSVQTPASSIVQQNYSDAPFGIPIDTSFDDCYLPYESPPSHTKTFPGACGRQRGIPQLASSIGRRRPQLGRSVDAPLPVQESESSMVHQNYSDAPFGIPIDTRFDDRNLPYESPPSHMKTFPGACDGPRGIPQLAGSIERRAAPAPASASYYNRANYSAAPFGVPIDTRFGGPNLPYQCPPSQTQSFPGAGAIQRVVPQLGRSINAPLPGQATESPDEYQNYHADSSDTYQNYSAAPFGIPINAEFEDSHYLPYESPPRFSQTYPQPTAKNRGTSPLGASLDQCGSSPRNVCTNDDEQSPRIMHMSSWSYGRVNNLPAESKALMIDAPGGVSVELVDDILKETSRADSFEPPSMSTPDNSSINVSLSFHQPPGFHDLRRAAGLNSLNNSFAFTIGNSKGNNTFAGRPLKVPCSSMNRNETF